MVAPPVKDVKKEDAVEEVIEPSQEIGKSVRHMIRGINARNEFGADGSKPLAVIEDELNAMLEQGYKFKYVQHLRSNLAPEGNMVLSEQMLYVFEHE
jgi:hypothetical protein